jgi:hypothetical protein
MSPKARQPPCARQRGQVVDADGNELDLDKGIFRPRSFTIRLKDVLHGLQSWIPYCLAAAFVFALARIVPVQNSSDVSALSATVRAWGGYFQEQWLAYGIIVACMVWLVSAKRPVYLMDFAVFEPPASWKVTKKEVMELLRLQGCYSEESLEFQERLLERNGTGDNTYWPPSIVQGIRPQVALFRGPDGEPRIPADRRVDNSIDQARAVAEIVMFSWWVLRGAAVAKRAVVILRPALFFVAVCSMDKLIASTGVRPSDIDFLVINCR